MHDLKFANEVLFVLRKNVGDLGKGKRVTVHARLSPFSHVTPEGLRQTFGQLAGGTEFTAARLDIQPLPFELLCRRCGRLSKAEAVLFACPHCTSADFDINKEKEFFVESVEIE